MATFIVFALIVFLAFELITSGTRWIGLIGMGLLVYAFPLYFLALALLAAGVFYYFDTH